MTADLPRFSIQRNPKIGVSDKLGSWLAAVGVDSLEFLAHPDGLVEPSIALRRDMAMAVRHHRPEVVVSINFRESVGGLGFKHDDHRSSRRNHLLKLARDAPLVE